MKSTVTIVCKKKDNRAFKAKEDQNWYNLNDNVIPYLQAANKGDKIEIEFEKKGVSLYVTQLVIGGGESKTEEKTSTGFKCESCGKELKTDKYKVCYDCNQAGNKSKSKSSGSSKPYNSDDRIAQIQRGNSLNAASMVASSQKFADVDAAGEYTKTLAEDFLNWLRAE